MKRIFLAALLFITGLNTQAATPDLILLTPYQADMNTNSWLMSEKLDGVRAYWDGRQLYSRKGNKLAAPDWFTDKLPPFELDGELWIKQGQFERIVSIVSRNEPHAGWQGISYHIFEVPNAQGGLAARLNKLRQYLNAQPLKHLRIIPQIICNNKNICTGSKSIKTIRCIG